MTDLKHQALMDEWISSDSNQKDQNLSVYDIMEASVKKMQPGEIAELFEDAVGYLHSTFLGDLVEIILGTGVTTELSEGKLIKYIIKARYIDSVGAIIDFGCKSNLSLVIRAPRVLLDSLKTEQSPDVQRKLAFAIWVLFCRETVTPGYPGVGKYITTDIRSDMTALLANNTNICEYARDTIADCIRCLSK